MKKIRNLTLGGIQQKIFNLVLIMIILVMAAYTVVILQQMSHINSLVKTTNDRQKETITDISLDTMDQVIAASLGSSTRMQARIADDMFADTANTVNILGDYTRMLFTNPDEYPAREVREPDASLDGTVSVQLLTAEGANLSSPALKEKLGLTGNLSEVMLSLYANAQVDSCYIALPEGVMLLADDHASSKLNEDGSVIHIPVLTREWYQGAEETGGLYFTDVSTDLFTGQVSVMCSVPVYVNDELVAVAGADLFLDDMAEYVRNSGENGGAACIINERGHVVFSPMEEGLFRVSGNNESGDLRETDNMELSAFIKDALAGNTDVRMIEADGSTWYMVGAPIDTVGWTVITLVDKEVTDQPTTLMSEQYDAISADAVSAFSSGLSGARTKITILLLVVILMAIIGALVVSTRIVKPLTVMTKRIVSLGGRDIQFMMDDTYRTGDEIEALAKSFADLSARTLQYVERVRTVTAEKERISAELNVATQIQADMLPRIFPPYPDRSEFDLYASMNPAKEVGGDFYDFFLIDQDHLGLVMADVSGKGVPAALFMVIAKTLIKNRTQMGDSPAKVLMDVNNQLCDGNEAGLFVTVWLAVLTISTGKGIAANAGHEHPALRHRSGRYELVKYRHSPAVATMEGLPFREHEFQLEPGDSLFVYTDGVPEATDSENELFGDERMLDALNANPDADPQLLLKNVKSGIDAFVGEAPQFDDITMLCLKYNGPAEKTTEGSAD